MPGILLARGVLTREQLDAAERFRQLRCALYGPPWPANSVALGYVTDDRKIVWMQCDFDRMISVLLPFERHVVQAVCVFDQKPRPEHYAPLKDGLDALAKQSERRCRRCWDIATCRRRDVAKVA